MDGLLEHPAECETINDATLDPESDDSARVLVHHDQHPVLSLNSLFKFNLVDAPHAVLLVTYKL
jgi:hypothetical protein